MSRETEATPTMSPAASAIGDIVNDTVTMLPSLRSRSVWYCSTRSPTAMRRSMSASVARRSGGNSSAAGRPTISCAV
jgi:hypothetical protein